MDGNQEPKLLNNTVSWLLTLITNFPHVIKKDEGAEEFANDLIESGIIFGAYSSDIYGAIQTFLPFARICPQIFKPEIGVKTFIEELSKAAVKFDNAIIKPKR